MYCKRCGGIVHDQVSNCQKCGGLPVESLTGSGGSGPSADRKDPWSSTYLQRRLKPTTTARPVSTYNPPMEIRPLGSPKYTDAAGASRPVRDATAGTRPSSMYVGSFSAASVLDSQVQSAIQRSVATQRAGQSPPQQQQQPQLQQPQPQLHRQSEEVNPQTRQLRSKWSQYFTSTASPQVQLAAGRGRSESLSTTLMNKPVAAASATSVGLQGARIPAKHSDLVARPFAAVQRPLTSDGSGSAAAAIAAASSSAAASSAAAARSSSATVSQPATATAAAQNRASPVSLAKSLAADPRNVISSFDQRKPLSSPISMAMRSRSATLPDLHSGDSRPCTTCGLLLRAEEQRQFASKQGVVYCTDCYHSSYSRGHCTGCNKIVLTHGRPWVQHGEKVWHKLCIKCRTCAKLLVAPLVDLEGMPTCEPCFMRCYPRELLRPMPKESTPAALLPQPVVTATAAKVVTSAAVPSQRTILPVVAPLVWGGGATAAASAAGVPSSFPARQTVDIKELERGSKRAVAAAVAATVAASIPTPVISEYDGGATSASNSPELQDMRQSKFVRAMDAMRIMSPVEVAEKEGLPRPRVIVDPEFGLLARVESQPVPAQDARRPSVSGSGPGLGNVLGHARSSSAKVDAIKSMLNQSVSPIDTSVAALYRPPLSPSLKNPNSPTARAGSSRSVSFRFDQTMESDASDEYDEEPVAPPRPEVHEPVQQQQDQQQQPEQEEEDDDEPKSLADYVLSKASSNKSKARLPSVADAIKKFSSPAMTPASAQRGEPLDRSQIPELKDLIRTHQREPPQEPTIPALDKHSRILKSRPRNNNRRQPTGSPQQQQQQLVPQMDTLPSPTSTVGPNQCARCARAIEDTWFRLSDGRQVHVECFTCQGCDKLIDDGVYVLENNVEFHPPCVPPTPPVVSVSPIPSSAHQQQQRQQQGSSLGRPMGPREPRREETCDRCHDHLVGPRFQLTNGKQYHPECFACAGCGQRFDEGSYVCFEGQEYHHQCVEKFAMAQKQEEDAANRGAAASGAGAGAADGLNGGGQDAGGFICAQCDGNIEGVFLRHNEAVFHPECFCCCDCRQAITPGMPFGEVEGCPCCEGCLEQRAASVAQQQMQRQRQQQMQMQNNWANNRQQQPTKSGY